MGFLMGAYGKLMAGKLVRDIQYQMTSVQSRLRQVTREIGDKEKYYQAQERNMKQQMQSQMMFANYGAAQYLGLPMGAMAGMGMSGLPMLGNDLTALALQGAAGQGGIDQNAYLMYSQFQQMMQMQFTQAQSMWQNTFEMERDADLQSLKDLEDSLQVEKDNLESRLQIARNEYDAYKQEEKADAKNLVPDYTGQG